MSYDLYLEKLRSEHYDYDPEKTELCCCCDVPFTEFCKKHHNDDVGAMLYECFSDCLLHIASDLTEIILNQIMKPDGYLCEDCFKEYYATFNHPLKKIDD